MSMRKETIIRAWKDPSFRASLSPDERAAIPESPSGRSLSELGQRAGRRCRRISPFHGSWSVLPKGESAPGHQQQLPTAPDQ